jgi:pimeloyl-ACP methyl ester carboxylesterase
MQSNPTISRRAATVRDLQISLNSIRLHYRDWGPADASPVLLIHGSGLSARAYDSLASGLADRFRVLAPDMRGHGESERATDYDWQRAYEDVEAFIQALELAPLSLVGHSMGARISSVYAARQPERVKRLVLIDWVPGATFTPEYRQVLADLFGMPRIDDPETVFQRARTGQPRLREHEFRHVITTSLAPRNDGGWRWSLDPEVLRGRDQAFSIDHETTAALARQVRCPTLLVRAAESEYVTREQAEQTVRDLADGRLVEIPESGHGLPWEQPELLLAAVRGFLIESP